MLGEPTPNEADPTGQTYAFEKALTKASKGKGKDLVPVDTRI